MAKIKLGDEADLRAVSNRMRAAAAVMAAVLLAGTVGYYLLGRGEWSLLDCAYMTVITISTVGYGETFDLAAVPGARLFTVILIVFGTGSLLYFVSQFTALVVEGQLRGAITRRHMQKKIERMSGHIILCGVGRTGHHVALELLATHTKFVIVDLDEERCERFAERIGDAEVLIVVGDATEDDTLLQAGIHRARGLVTTLDEDRDNVFVTLTARGLNEHVRIVSKAVEPSAHSKLKRAGADAVVAPHAIGGLRIASEMVRPSVVQFLDVMLREKENPLRIEEILIPDGSTLIGRELGETDIAAAVDVLVMAIRQPDGAYLYNPDVGTELLPGTHLIVLAETKVVKRLRDAVAR